MIFSNKRQNDDNLLLTKYVIVNRDFMHVDVFLKIINGFMQNLKSNRFLRLRFSEKKTGCISTENIHSIHLLRS